MEVNVEVEQATPPAGTVVNTVKVEGGGAAPVSTGEPSTLPNTVEGPSNTFDLSGFSIAARGADGQVDTQAGDHAHGMTTTLSLHTQIDTFPDASHLLISTEPVKDVAVNLPLGFLGDPKAAGRCTELQLLQGDCPPDSIVGTATVLSNSSVLTSNEPAEGSVITDVYSMVPDNGFPAQFGFNVLGHTAPLYASVVHTPSGYALRVATPGVPRAIPFNGAQLNLFGNPNEADGNPSASQSFFTNPSNCSAGPLRSRVEVDPWSAPGTWSSLEAVAYPGITGCELLQFQPSVELRPEVTQAEEPTGTEVKITVPQSPERFPILATPDLKDITITLPEGMTVSPGGGDGLAGCEATGPNGIDMPANLPGGRLRTPTEAGEGEAIGPDGMSHLTPGHCPLTSQIGTVQVVTPVLDHPLEGHLYLAQPQCGGGGQPECTSADAANGRLFGLYLEAAGSGVVVKLAGTVSANPSTGQLTARFNENPQLPFSEVTVHIKGGVRAPLANPRQCGRAVTNADLTPWSAPMTPDALVSTWFPVDWNGAGEPCPATVPFTPGLQAGSVKTVAGNFSPFATTISRGNRQQDLARVQVKAPVGLLAMISHVPLCGEPQAAQGTCSEASRIGTTWAAVGSGAHPLWVSGRVYLTGPYEGAPFGLSVVVPAVAGPFNLGNVVVRARIDVDPRTAAATVTSDSVPRILDGIPLRIQTLSVVLDRPGFVFNPTNCSAKQVTATLEAEQGASANVSVPFAVEGCKALPFKPTFKVSTQGATSKSKGASLDVKVTSGTGQANIAKALVLLPKQLPARLTTLQQACPEATFAANPATCPSGSNVGTAKAVTPVLNEPLSGPAYLVSHGGAAFPDLVVILQSQGVRLDLVGNTNIKKGITTSTFAAVPDAPISSFELKLPEGPHSALATNLPAKARGNLCGKKLVMPTTLTGQNGAQLKQSTAISVSSCAKPTAHTTRRARHGRRRV